LMTEYHRHTCTAAQGPCRLPRMLRRGEACASRRAAGGVGAQARWQPGRRVGRPVQRMDACKGQLTFHSGGAGQLQTGRDPSPAAGSGRGAWRRPSAARAPRQGTCQPGCRPPACQGTPSAAPRRPPRTRPTRLRTPTPQSTAAATCGRAGAPAQARVRALWVLRGAAARAAAAEACRLGTHRGLCAVAHAWRRRARGPASGAAGPGARAQGKRSEGGGPRQVMSTHMKEKSSASVRRTPSACQRCGTYSCAREQRPPLATLPHRASRPH